MDRSHDTGVSPLVSVVIPTRNRAVLVRRAITSVLQQTCRSFELIVVDDGSKDGTAEVVKSFADDRVRYLRHSTSRGASAARNTGIECSGGEFIAFLDDDDEWLPPKLEEQLDVMRNAPPLVGLVYCWMDYFDSGGRLVAEVHPVLRGNVFGMVLDRQRLGGCPTLLVRKAAVDEVGGFDEALPRGNDGDFIRRVCLKYEVDLVPKVLVRVHVGHGSPQITSSDKEGIRNAIKGHGVKLVKFKDELREYPAQTAAICANIAYLYSRIGDWRSSMTFYLRAVKTSPLSPRVYFRVLQALRDRVIKHTVS